METETLFTTLRGDGVDEDLLRQVQALREENPVSEALTARIPQPDCPYYGAAVWNAALAALLAGKNLLLSGPKATGKNVLCENLAALFGRPSWDVSFHVGMDASYLIGADSFDGSRVVFKPGPVWLAARDGGFAVLDEINMAKNEALAVLHSVLDFRRVIDVPGYERLPVHPMSRFIGTMNYGYAGTRELNEALCSRFLVISMPIISEDNLRRILLGQFPKLEKKALSQFVRLFYELNEKAEHAEISERAVDLRGLLDALRMMELGIPAGTALRMGIVNKCFDAYEQKLIADVLFARISEKTGPELFR